ncbi:MAG TPA: hypothetical protein VMD58_10455 [Acidobacteriaceae bacterium]|nr:hypothetical protein [Acidobacteriaceae bacterium]
MSHGDLSFFSASFTIITVLLLSLRERLKRIESKLDDAVRQNSLKNSVTR